ncbi:hypothetical protein DENSPDRAFT_876847 [Dentipellis sp. KUC8613]|nr:hypothetical protein DENSPDRAFT_876847 [Dentipellis sp. KUC8613]
MPQNPNDTPSPSLTTKRPAARRQPTSIVRTKSSALRGASPAAKYAPPAVMSPSIPRPVTSRGRLNPSPD